MYKTERDRKEEREKVRKDGGRERKRQIEENEQDSEQKYSKNQ